MTRKTMLCLFASLLAVALPVFAMTYHFTTINPFNSVETSARGINNGGDVVGDFATAAQNNHGTESGFLLHNGAFTKLNVPFPGATDTDANGTNNDGDVVGNWDINGTTTSVNHGYVRSEGKYINLPDPPNQDGFPDFNAINDYDDIVGVLFPVPSVNGNRGFLFSGGTYTLIDCGHSSTEANGINDDGDIVGECFNFPNTTEGFLLRDGTYYLIDFPNAIGTVASGINNGGAIAGTYTDINGVDHGFVVMDFPAQPIWQTIDVPSAVDTTVVAINDGGSLAGSFTKNQHDRGFEALK